MNIDVDDAIARFGNLVVGTDVLPFLAGPGRVHMGWIDFAQGEQFVAHRRGPLLRQPHVVIGTARGVAWAVAGGGGGGVLTICRFSVPQAARKAMPATAAMRPHGFEEESIFVSMN